MNGQPVMSEDRAQPLAQFSVGSYP